MSIEAKTFPYTCCFCGAPGHVTYEVPQGFEREILSLMKFLPRQIACDPCGDYERKKRDLKLSILKRAQKLEGLTNSEKELVNDIFAKKFERLFRKLCEIYSARFKKHVPYDSQMTYILLDQPQKARAVLKGIHQMATTRTCSTCWPKKAVPATSEL